MRYNASRHREGGGEETGGYETETAATSATSTTKRHDIGTAATAYSPSPYVALPPGWRENVDAAAYSLRRNLRVNTKYALALAKEWHSCHLDEPLTDVSSDTFCEGLPYEATVFDDYQKRACESAKNGLWDLWRVESARTLVDGTLNGGAIDQNLFDTIATQQASELRALVRRRVEEYAAFFKKRSYSDEHLECDPLHENLMWAVSNSYFPFTTFQ